MAHVDAMSDEQVVSTLASFEDGTKIIVLYHHPRDPLTPRVIKGTLFATATGFVVKRTATQRYRLPSPNAIVRSIELAQAGDEVADVQRPRAHSEVLTLEGDELQEPTQQAQRQQPPPRDDTVVTSNMLFNLLKMQNESQAKQLEAQARQVDRLVKLVEDARAQREDDRRPSAIGNDVTTLLQMTDALSGRDNPTWRVAPGLIMPRFIPERFMIFSIPHLLFKEDSSTGEMVKLPKGAALPLYKSLLSTCKLQFPNQVPTRTVKRDDKKMDAAILSVEGSAGVRSQLERCERMFADLLARLDNTDAKDLPSTKTEWMLFIDAGMNVLDLYATLGFGFLKGGAKSSIQYSTSIHSSGKFDPSKLWPSEFSTPSSQSFQ